MRYLSLAAVFVALAAPVSADVRLAPNGLRVEFTENQFEVFTIAGWSPAALFCAAGEVAKIAGANGSDRLVVTRGVGPSPTRPNRRSATFELVPRDQAEKPPFFNITVGFGPGLSISVAAAAFACEQQNFLRTGPGD